MTDEHVIENGAMVVGANRGWIDSMGIVHIVIGAARHRMGEEYTVEDVRDALELGSRLADGLPRLVLTDIRSIRSTTAEARRTPTPSLVKRLAIVVDSPVSRMLGNAYLGITRPVRPTRMFDSEETATEWLLRH